MLHQNNDSETKLSDEDFVTQTRKTHNQKIAAYKQLLKANDAEQAPLRKTIKDLNNTNLALRKEIAQLEDLNLRSAKGKELDDRDQTQYQPAYQAFHKLDLQKRQYDRELREAEQIVELSMNTDTVAAASSIKDFLNKKTAAIHASQTANIVLGSAPSISHYGPNSHAFSAMSQSGIQQPQSSTIAPATDNKDDLTADTRACP